MIFFRFNPISEIQFSSIAHHMSNTRCELLARDSVYNFSFSYIDGCCVEFQNKRKFQTQLHNNLWFHSNMILFFIFGRYYDLVIVILKNSELWFRKIFVFQSFYARSDVIFWKFSMTIIKDLYSNKVNCIKQRNIKTKTQKYHRGLLPVLYVCISFRKSYVLYSYLLLTLNMIDFYAISLHL